MSSVVTFTMVTPEELERALRDPEWAAERIDEELDFDEIEDDLEEPEPDGDLDKAWSAIEFLATSAGIGFSIYGGSPIEDAPSELDAWSPEEVAEAAARLAEAPFERLAVHFDPERMNAEDVYPRSWEPDDIEWVESHYKGLVAFFAAAAAARNAAIMEFNQ